MHLAGAAGNLEMIGALLEGGADINLPAHNGETPLMYAVLSRKRAAAEKLLEAGAEVRIYRKKFDGIKILHIIEFFKRIWAFTKCLLVHQPDDKSCFAADKRVFGHTLPNNQTKTNVYTLGCHMGMHRLKILQLLSGKWGKRQQRVTMP